MVGRGFIWRSRLSHMPAPRLVPLTSYPELETQPSLSPDGSQVAFSWKGDIYVKAVGAEQVVQVTKDPAVESWPAWSPDGSQIAFVRNGEVFLVSPLGGPERKVAESSGRVAWIPDGSARSPENVVLWRSEHFSHIACDGAEAAPHIPGGHQHRRRGYGDLPRRPDTCLLPDQRYRGVRSLSDAGGGRRATPVNQ